MFTSTLEINYVLENGKHLFTQILKVYTAQNSIIKKLASGEKDGF
jgi:hypothetical protein